MKMKKVIMSLVIVFICTYSINVAMASQLKIEGTIVIGPYNSNQSAISGLIETQVENAIQKLKSLQREGYYLNIGIEGSTDEAGKYKDNETLSRLRAEAVAGRLNFPLGGARISLWPKGSTDNVREVKIHYELIATPVVKTATQSIFSSKEIKLILVALGSVIALLLLRMAVAVIRARNNSVISQITKTSILGKQKVTDNFEDILIQATTKDGKAITIKGVKKVVKDKTIFFVPIKDGDRDLNRDSYQLLKKATRLVVRNLNSDDVILTNLVQKEKKAYFSVN